MTRPVTVLLLTLVTLGVTDRGVAAAQTFDEVFDTSALHEIRLYINGRDLADLREHYRENTYYPADMEWGGARLRSIGVRSRGNASRSATKLNLRLDFNRYVSGQRFADVQSLQLDNLWQDASMMHESIAMAFYSRMGMPSSRESYARVYVNDVYEGLYAIVESIDNHYLDRYVGESAGRLYEYHWLKIYHFEDLGDDLAEYGMFQPANHDNDPESMHAGPIRDMVRSVNEPADGIWPERTNEYVNLRQLVTYLAIEEFIAEADGFAGESGMANFYLYQMADSNQHMFLPWDRDRAFRRPDASVLERLNENVLTLQALSYPELASLYLDVLEACARSAEQDDWLENEIARTASVIGAAAIADSNKPFDNHTFGEGVADMMHFARERSREVLEQTARIRAQFR